MRKITKLLLSLSLIFTLLSTSIQIVSAGTSVPTKIWDVNSRGENDISFKLSNYIYTDNLYVPNKNLINSLIFSFTLSKTGNLKVQLFDKSTKTVVESKIFDSTSNGVFTVKNLDSTHTYYYKLTSINKTQIVGVGVIG